MVERSTRDERERALPWVERSRARFRCSSLLAAIVLQLVLSPHLAGRAGSLVNLLLATAVPIAAVYAVSTGRHTLIAAAILAVPTIILAWVPEGAGGPIVDQVGVGAVLVFYAFTTIIVLRYVLGGARVTVDKLYGAVAAYLLVGLTFAAAYTLLDLGNPGSFDFVPEHYPAGRLEWTDMVFFSLTTLTTLGYGDITPITSKGRSLATLEAAIGVMYSAVLIARLVGAFYAGRGLRAD